MAKRKPSTRRDCIAPLAIGIFIALKRAGTSDSIIALLACDSQDHHPQVAQRKRILPDLRGSFGDGPPMVSFFRRRVAVCRKHKRKRSWPIAVALLVFIVVVALAGPSLAPHNPLHPFVNARLQAPSVRFPLGTDNLGRCVLSRLLTGARLTICSALAVVAVSVVIGVAVGAGAGMAGGTFDEFAMRVVDVCLSFPGLLIALGVVGVVGPGLFPVVGSLIAMHWARYARLVRSVVLETAEQPYVLAARALGASGVGLFLRHFMPRIWRTVRTVALAGVGHMIAAIGGLSFLGFGVQPPTPEWGAMLARGRAFIHVAPWTVAAPTVAIVLAVLTFHLVADSLWSDSQ